MRKFSVLLTGGRLGVVLRHTSFLFVVAAAFALLNPTSAWPDTTSAEDNWPQWRGPTRDGKVAGAAWPSQLDEQSLIERWRIPLGPGYSGPLIVNGRVFVTETKDEKFEVVRGLKLETGEQLWTAEWEGAMQVPFFARSNGDWIRSTPAYDDGRLYVGGMRDVLVCLNAEDGTILWKRDFVADLGSTLPAFGFVSSPLIVGDDLYVQAGGAVLKLNKMTGEVVWKALQDGGGMNGSAFSSPTMATLGGQQQLLVQTRTTLAGVQPATGEVLWSQEIPAFRGMNILTPTVEGDTVFTSSYGGESLLLRISPPADGGKWQVSQVWSKNIQGYMSTPVVIQGHAYMHLRNQRFSCIRLADGEETWRSTTYGKYCSLVAKGDTIMALDERGELLLLRAKADAFELIARRKVSDNSTWAHLAVTGNHVVVRELSGIAAFQWKE